MNVVPLGELMPSRIPSINPAAFPDEPFTLWSIPSFDAGAPEHVLGREVGSPKKAVQEGDVLLSKIVPHIRRAWKVSVRDDRRQIASSEWITFQHNAFLSDYIRHFLLTDIFHKQFMGTVAGVGGSLLRAQPKHVAKIGIPLLPLEEQRRIVGLLDRAAEIRCRADAARAKARAIIPSLFLNMFGDPATNTKGWQTRIFEQVMVDVTRLVPKIMRREYEKSGDFPIFDQGQVEVPGFTSNKSLTYESADPIILFGDHTRVFRLVNGRFARGADGVRLFRPVKGLDPSFVRTFLELHGLPNAGYSRHYRFLKEVGLAVPPLPLQTAFAEQVERLETIARALDAAVSKAEAIAAALSAEVFGEARQPALNDAA